MPPGAARSLRAAACLLLLVVPFAALPSAQTPSLADLARKEAERRKSGPAAGKVYTNKDLPPSAAAPRPAAGSDAGAPAEESAPRPAGQQEHAPAEAPEEIRNEAWWKARIVAARDELRRNEMFADALQTKVNALSRDFVNRDNPVQRAQIGQQRAEALDELARVKGDILKGRQQIDEIEEEARKAGVPPGWLR